VLVGLVALATRCTHTIDWERSDKGRGKVGGKGGKGGKREGHKHIITLTTPSKLVTDGPDVILLLAWMV